MAKVIRVCPPWNEPTTSYENRAEGVMWPEYIHQQTHAFHQSLSCYVQAINGRGIITCGGTVVATADHTEEGYLLTLSHEHGPEWGSEYIDPEEGTA